MQAQATVLGLSIGAFTQFHVALSLVGIVTGLVVLASMIAGRMSAGWTGVFLATTVLTSLTGFLFPVSGLLPSHVVGIISLVVLAGALFALYSRHLAGVWRTVYVVTATIALYLNCFVGVVQSFLKLGFLQSATSLQGVAQGLVLVALLVAGFLAVRKFRPG